MDDKKKTKGGMSGLFELAAEHKSLLALSGALAALAAIASFVPYIAIYLILREILAAYPNFIGMETERLLNFGLLAIGGVLLDVLSFFSPPSVPILRRSEPSID